LSKIDRKFNRDFQTFSVGSPIRLKPEDPFSILKETGHFKKYGIPIPHGKEKIDFFHVRTLFLCVNENDSFLTRKNYDDQAITLAA